MVKDAGFYREYESLLAETNSFASDAPRLKDLRKLRLMSIMRAEHLPYANQQNLRILANEQFHKFVVDIVYIDAVLDKNRMRRESKEFFQENISTAGINIYSSPVLSDNLVRALTADNINNYLKKITGYGTENIQTKDILIKTKQEYEQENGLSAAEKAFKEMFVAFANNYQAKQKSESGYSASKQARRENENLPKRLAEQQLDNDRQHAQTQRQLLELVDMRRGAYEISR